MPLERITFADAGRKINNEIAQYMHVLPAAQTVIIEVGLGVAQALLECTNALPPESGVVAEGDGSLPFYACIRNVGGFTLEAVVNDGLNDTEVRLRGRSKLPRKREIPPKATAHSYSRSMDSEDLAAPPPLTIDSIRDELDRGVLAKAQAQAMYSYYSVDSVDILVGLGVMEILGHETRKYMQEVGLTMKGIHSVQAYICSWPGWERRSVTLESSVELPGSGTRVMGVGGWGVGSSGGSENHV